MRRKIQVIRVKKKHTKCDTDDPLDALSISAIAIANSFFLLLFSLINRLYDFDYSLDGYSTKSYMRSGTSKFLFLFTMITPS